jgi:hypothetical protein
MQNFQVLFRSGLFQAKNEPELDIYFVMIYIYICRIVSERSVHKLSQSKLIFDNLHRPVEKMQVLAKWAGTRNI